MRSISKILVLENHRYYAETAGHMLYLCKKELERVIGRELPSRIKVTIYDRSGKDRIRVVVERRETVYSNWGLVFIDSDGNDHYLMPGTKQILDQRIPRKPGRYVIYFKVESA